MPQEGTHGFQGWQPKPGYATYRSPYGPNYTVPRNFAGIDRRLFLRYSLWGASFAGVGGIFALFFFSDLPRVRKDIMQKVPFIGSHFVREVPPSDNPF